VSGEIVAVLVVPAEGDPGGLLASGRFPSWPPTAIRVETPIGATWVATVSNDFDPDDVRALVLWWDGALVPEGWDRARRVYEATGWDTPEFDPLCALARPDPDLALLVSIAEGLVRQGLASRVVRLARDADDRLVEVTP
jgi:hypothetical protein